MKIALIGASGFVGTAVLNELLSRNHQVTGLVRNPEKITEQDNVKAVKADVNNVPNLTDAVNEHDAVISTFNAGWKNPNLYEDFLAGSRNIQQAVKLSNVNRLLVVGGAGSLYIDGKQLVDGPDFPAEIKAGADAARVYLNEIKAENDLDWTFLSPAIEMHQGTAGVRTGKYRTGTENPVFNDEGRSWISVEDMAVAIVDEIEKPQFIKQRFTVGY